MTTPPVVAPVRIVREAVQYTPDREPVLIQYAGAGVTSGPFASSQLHYTTQAALAARIPAEGRAAFEAAGLDPAKHWGDDESAAELLAHLAEHGIAAVIVPNVDPPQPAESPETPRLEAAPDQAPLT